LYESGAVASEDGSDPRRLERNYCGRTQLP
jgi:hypothetical protein